LANLVPARLACRALKWVYRGFQVPEGSFDLVLSAGGNTLPANAILAGGYRCPNLFVGSIRRLKPDLFWRILFYQAQKPAPPFIHWKITPVPIHETRLKERADAFLKQYSLAEGPLWSLLIGGDGGGYVFSEQDWRDLVQLMESCASRFGIRWLVVTSRRTGALAESILGEMTKQDAVAYMSLYASDGGEHYFDVLGAGERVFVTEDSHMMVTEAVYSGKPVVTLRPRQATPDPSNRHFLEQYEQEKYIVRQAIQTSFQMPDATESTFESPLKRLGMELTEMLRQTAGDAPAA